MARERFWLEDSGWITHRKVTCRHIASDDRAGADEGPVANIRPLKDNGARANEDATANFNRLRVCNELNAPIKVSHGCMHVGVQHHRAGPQDGLLSNFYGVART